MQRYLLFLLGVLGLSSNAQQAHTVTSLSQFGFGSLGHYIINSASGDTIRFDSGLIAGGSDTIRCYFPMIFNHGLVIEGLFNAGDTLYLSGEDSTQIFYMDFLNNPGEEVHLKDLFFVKGRQYAASGTAYNAHGGAVMARGLDVLRMENVLFRDCQATGNARGGAFASNNCDLVILEGCRFEGNQTDTTSSDGYGGAIFDREGNLKVNNCTFRNNQSAVYGGAISSEAGGIWIRNSRFAFNRTSNVTVPGQSNTGGMVDVWYDSVCHIDSSSFYGGYAVARGGAVSVGPGFAMDLEINYCFFENNSTDYYGAAVYAAGSYLDPIIRYCTFLNNGSDELDDSALEIGGSATINKCTFINNQSGLGSTIRLGSGTIVNTTIVAKSPGAPLVTFVGTGTTAGLSNSILSQHPSGATVQSPSRWVSGGYNILSDSPSFAAGLDQTNIDSVALALQPLGMYGGFSPTRPPSATSVARDAGAPTNFTPAQNGPIYGQRDVGAAEYQYIVQDSTLACGTVNWWGNTYSTPGTYTDTVFNANSIDSVGVLELYGQNLTVMNQNGVLVAQSQEPGTTYQWLYCDSSYAPVPAATAQSFTPLVNGNYAVVLTNGSCTDTSDCMNYNEVGLPEINSKEAWLSFYPNPTKGQITFSAAGEQPHVIEVLDIHGRKLWSEQISTTTLQLPKLSAGLYLLRWIGKDDRVQLDRVMIRD